MEKYYLEKISNLKDIRRYCFAIFTALTAWLTSIYLNNEYNAKTIFVLITGVLVDIAAFLQYIHVNSLINKYLRRLK